MASLRRLIETSFHQRCFGRKKLFARKVGQAMVCLRRLIETWFHQRCFGRKKFARKVVQAEIFC